MSLLKPGGRYLCGNPTVAKMLRSVSISTFTDKRAQFAFAGETTEELDTLRDMIEAGTLRAVVDEVFPLEQAAEGHRRVESEERRGMVVRSLA